MKSKLKIFFISIFFIVVSLFLFDISIQNYILDAEINLFKQKMIKSRNDLLNLLPLFFDSKNFYLVNTDTSPYSSGLNLEPAGLPLSTDITD